MRKIFPAADGGPGIVPAAGNGPGQVTDQAIATVAGLYAYPASPVPWVRANMVASLDGAASLDGRTRELSGAADRLVFSVLRSLADVILVGAGTARAEGYRPVRESEVWAALREGRAATPPIAVVTRALDLDPDGPLLAGAPAGARTIVLTTAAAPAAVRSAAARHAEVVVAGRDRVRPDAAIGALAAHGHLRILVEGGPTLLRQITGAGLMDELCLTMSPVLEGGRAGRILAAPEDGLPPGDGAGGRRAAATRLNLAHVLEDSGSLLCRYLRAAGWHGTLVPPDELER